MSIAYLLSSADTSRSRSNDPNSVSHAFFAQMTPLNIDENASTSPSIPGGALEIDSRGKGSCRDNEAGALILLEAAEPDCTKGHYNAASQDSQSTEILQGGFRLPGEEHQHITTAVDPRGKEDSTSQQYARKLKRRRSSYEGLDMSSRTRSQASQRLSEAGSGVPIPSHGVEKQTTCKKKKARLDGLSSSSTRSIPAKADVPRIIDSYHGLAQTRASPAMYGQNPTQITQPELATQIVSGDLHTNPSTPGESIAAPNRIGERPLQADETTQRLGLLKAMTRRLARDCGLKYIWKDRIRWLQNLLPTFIRFTGDQPPPDKYLRLTYGQLLHALTPSERQEYLRLVMRNRSHKLATAIGVSTRLASALWDRAELEEPISVDEFEYHLRAAECHPALTAFASLCDLERVLGTRKNGT